MPEIFDYIKSFTNKKVKYSTDEDFKGYSQWMINRFLSTDDSLLPVIAEINTEYILSDKAHYNLFYNIIPKSSKFFKYDYKKEKSDVELGYMMEYFKCDTHLAKTYSELISKEEYDTIISFYTERGFGKSKGKKKKK